MSPAPHSPHTDAAHDLAQRLFAREVQSDGDDDALLAAAEQLCLRVPDGLSRWFGKYGSRALLTRALAKVQREHPSLAGVTVTSAQSPCFAGLGESARTHGAKTTAEGIVAMLAALADLMGRLIGDDLVPNLLEQSTAASAAGEPEAPGGASAPPGARRAHSVLTDPGSANAGTTHDVSPMVKET